MTYGRWQVLACPDDGQHAAYVVSTWEDRADALRERRRLEQLDPHTRFLILIVIVEDFEYDLTEQRSSVNGQS